MSYSPDDAMPSIFLLRESKRQSILTVFNWTERQTQHKFDLNADLDLQVQGHNQVFDVFDSKAMETNLNSIELSLPPHSVRVVKIVDSSIPAAAPMVKMKVSDKAKA